MYDYEKIHASLVTCAHYHHVWERTYSKKEYKKILEYFLTPEGKRSKIAKTKLYDDLCNEVARLATDYDRKWKQVWSPVLLSIGERIHAIFGSHGYDTDFVPSRENFVIRFVWKKNQKTVLPDKFRIEVCIPDLARMKTWPVFIKIPIHMALLYDSIELDNQTDDVSENLNAFHEQCMLRIHQAFEQHQELAVILIKIQHMIPEVFNQHGLTWPNLP